MLGRPAVLGLRAVVVRPDDLVEERLAAEEGVEQDLRVVRLAVIEMEVQRPVVGEEAPRLDEPRLEEAPVVVEAVVVLQEVALDALVAAPLEAERLGLGWLHLQLDARR